jgi:hypothetical protein
MRDRCQQGTCFWLSLDERTSVINILTLIGFGTRLKGDFARYRCRWLSADGGDKIIPHFKCS